MTNLLSVLNPFPPLLVNNAFYFYDIKDRTNVCVMQPEIIMVGVQNKQLIFSKLSKNRKTFKESQMSKKVTDLCMINGLKRRY